MIGTFIGPAKSRLYGAASVVILTGFDGPVATVSPPSALSASMR